MRRLGSFLPGEGVGGAGTGTALPGAGDHELRIRTKYEERYGKNFVPSDMPLQDWGISGPERALLRQVRIHGVRQAGNIKGQIQKEGNSSRIRAPATIRCRRWSLTSPADVREDREELGYTLTCGRPRTPHSPTQSGRNEDRAMPILRLLRALRLRGERQGQPHITVIPVALRNPNVSCAPILGHKVLKLDRQEGDRRRLCQRADRQEMEQPADLVILSAYGLSNVHLMLLSGIGKPYNPETQTGVIGKNYAYQGGANVTLFFEGRASIRSSLPAAGAPRSTTSHQLEFRPWSAWLCRWCLHFCRRLERASDHLSTGAAGHAAMGLGLEAPLRSGTH
jgi:gluconate 2-dehydrogenase alpha chain